MAILWQDYFDVIDTPMDFGTICKEIERGQKYMNSEDVYRDVKLIWQNCYQYNNKGDFIIDLMRRVKKNFSKYWGAAGLSGTPTDYFLSLPLNLSLYCISFKYPSLYGFQS